MKIFFGVNLDERRNSSAISHLAAFPIAFRPFGFFFLSGTENKNITFGETAKWEKFSERRCSVARLELPRYISPILNPW